MAHDQSPYRARTSPDVQPSALWRNAGKWSVGFGLFVALLALLTSLQLFQLTAEGAADRTLRRSVAALTEIDPLLDRGYDDLQLQAQNAGPGETVELRDFPIAVPLRGSDVRGMSKEQLRDVLLDRSAHVMYSNGTAPLRSPVTNNGGAGRFSVAGLTQHGLGFLRSRNHDILAVTTFALAALCIVLAVILAAMCRGFGRLASVGAVVVAASIPVVVGGIGARFYLRIASDSDTEFIQREFLEIGQGLAWIPIRDGAAFTILGLVFLTTGVVCAAWADRREAPRPSVAQP
jgi:uncharacterized membrane protein